jgi:hypothetical protein
VQELELPRGVGLDALQLAPSFRTVCGRGYGLAVCPALGLLVTSNPKRSCLDVFGLTARKDSVDGEPAVGLARVGALEGAALRPRVQFKFVEGSVSGFLTFMGPHSARRLLVTDVGCDAVHIVDVVGRAHVGYVAAPGSIAGPRGVAARGSLVAVGVWRKGGSGDHVVQLFEGSGTSWTALRVVAGGFGHPGRADGQLCIPRGLRFTGDGTGLVVADYGNKRASRFSVADGSFVGHIVVGVPDPRDVEEYDGGWLVACGDFHVLHVIDGVVVGTLGGLGFEDGEFYEPTVLAMVRGVGLMVRDSSREGRVQVYITPDVVAMDGISSLRMAWMVAVVRGGLRRRPLRTFPQQH